MRAVVPAVRAAGFALALLERLPGDTDWAGTLGGRVLARDASPVLTFGVGSWDELLAGWSANRRGQARRIERRLEREHDHRYVLTGDRGTLSDDLDVLFALHKERWGADSPFLADMAFHRDFAAVALDRGWLRLWRLEVDGRPAAAWYGLRFGAAESYYQAGRDPGMEDRRVGLALLLHTMRSALETGASEYRFLRGDEPFKLRFASHDPGIVTIGLGVRSTGRALVATVDRLARSPARRLLRGAAR
jgi:CelD/BcsL family acetyltransferase involved in cellulose biosynthesis